MSAELKTGGPAFPDGSTNPWGVPEKAGMTLRDYFAAKAMQSFLIDLDCKPGDLPSIAVSAYMMADAMLEVRE